ncbi:MAG: pyridoxal-dependent decarboxylase [Pseudomonadota bacterium]
MLDRALDHMQGSGTGRVWTPVPETLSTELDVPLPREPSAPDALLADIMPHGVGNTHPRFFGWVHGAGTPAQMLPAMVEAAMNANCGGRDHVGLRVERQVISWMTELFGFPSGAGGLVVSGTSMATLIALKAARDHALAGSSRSEGVSGARLVGYTSSEAHSCVARDFDTLGLGTEALRRVPVTDAFEMDVEALSEAIAADRKAGYSPFCIIGTAGTVNTGAIDPLAELAALARAEGLWLHVDGAFGACAQMAPALAPRLSGIKQADSLAFDFHKWMHVTYDAGCVLFRDQSRQAAAFANRPDYLAGESRGLAAGAPWPVDLGPELSRGFRALKVWAQLTEFGTNRLGALVQRNCDQAAFLADRVDEIEELERLAPVSLQIVCFRVKRRGLSETELDALNREIVIGLQEEGRAAPSTTRINGKLAIRVNLTNHRTHQDDLEGFLQDVLTMSRSLT